MIAIVDYGLGNIGSIKNMLLKIGVSPLNIILAKNVDEIRSADKFILPGVGSFDKGMELLVNSGMKDELDNQVIINKKPILGICLGMQMLGNSSEEGNSKGLGYIPFKCLKFNPIEQNIKVPHMCWDYVKIQKKDNNLVKELDVNNRFYFVHSYYAECDNEDDVLMTCDYSVNFACAVARNNVYGVQFHPEKSHKYGMKLLDNFVRNV